MDDRKHRLNIHRIHMEQLSVYIRLLDPPRKVYNFKEVLTETEIDLLINLCV